MPKSITKTSSPLWHPGRYARVTAIIVALSMAFSAMSCFHKRANAFSTLHEPRKESAKSSLANVTPETIRQTSNAINDLTVIALTNSPSVIVSFNPTAHLPTFSPIEKYTLGYSTSSIDDSNWDSITKLERSDLSSDMAVWNYFRVNNLNYSTTYYFALKAWNSTVGYSALSNVVSIKTTDSAKSWNSASFATMPSDSWMDLKPALPSGGTSQVSYGYDAVNDVVMTWGGHPSGGGYPQVDDLYTYDLNLAPGGEWTLENLNFINSDKPVGGCTNHGNFLGSLPTDEQYFLGMGRQPTQRYEYWRKFYLEQGPWLYDFHAHKWFDAASIDYKPRDYGSLNDPSAWDPDDGILFIVRVTNTWNRYVLYNPYKNETTFIPVNTWSDLGGSRQSQGLVYDSKRKQFIFVAAAWMTADSGPGGFMKDVWTFDIRGTKKWTQVQGVIGTQVLPSRTNKFIGDVAAAYDSIHDKVIMFVLAVGGSYPLVSEEAKLIMVFIYDPSTKTWTRGNDMPWGPKGHRQMDLNAAFSEKHNAVILLDVGRNPSENIGNRTAAYRYSNVPATAPNITPPVRNYPRFVKEGFAAVSDATHVQINWTPRSEDKNVAGYNVYRALVSATPYPKNRPPAYAYYDLPQYTRDVIQNITPPAAGDFTKLNSKLIAGTSYNDSGVNLSGGSIYPYKVYAYYVTAVDSSGHTSGRSPFWFTIPQSPVALAVRNNTSTYDLSWTAPHNGGQGITAYRVYVADTDYTVRELTTNAISQTSYSISKKGIGTYNRFYITAIDSLGQEGVPSGGVWGNYMYASIYNKYGLPGTPPAPPKNFMIK
jgi:hypothetical protein